MKLIREEIETVEFVTEERNGKKSLYIEGVFLQGNIKNRNGRMYPMQTLAKEVQRYNESNVVTGRALGELGHPDGPTVNLERVSHMITSLQPDGKNFIGEAKVMDTPYGKIVKNLIDEGAKLGVSSRGSGNVKEDGSGEVSDFEIITVDVVAQPSAPGAYPTPIYEHLMNTRGGYKAYELAQATKEDQKAQKYLKESLINIISRLQ